jgi:biotin carboxyl carrier protein
VADGGEERAVTASSEAGGTESGVREAVAVVVRGETAHVDVGGRSVAIRVAPPPDVDRAALAAGSHGGTGPAEVLAPMPGNVLAVHVAVGAKVEAGDPIVTLEAMKMEHIVAAPAPGTVAEIGVRRADQVTRGQVLAVVEP